MCRWLSVSSILSIDHVAIILTTMHHLISAESSGRAYSIGGWWIQQSTGPITDHLTTKIKCNMLFDEYMAIVMYTIIIIYNKCRTCVIRRIYDI